MRVQTDLDQRLAGEFRDEASQFLGVSVTRREGAETRSNIARSVDQKMRLFNLLRRHFIRIAVNHRIGGLDGLRMDRRAAFRLLRTGGVINRHMVGAGGLRGLMRELHASGARRRIAGRRSASREGDQRRHAAQLVERRHILLRIDEREIGRDQPLNHRLGAHEARTVRIGDHQQEIDHVPPIVDVELIEQPTGELSFGVGYSSTEGVIGDIGYTERNLFGNGQLLRRLAKLLPEARIVGIDGSKKLLAMNAATLTALGHEAAVCDAAAAFDRRGPRIRLTHSFLPSFRLAEGRADAVAFCFPNITASAADQAHYDRHGYKIRIDVNVARMLGRFREMDPEDEVSTLTPQEHFDDLMTSRVISRDLRRLLKKGGLLYRVEYANCKREELSELTTWRVLFAEGALATPIKDERVEALFRYTGSAYYRSKVILDVYHQTGNKDDRSGGYYIADFTAA